MGCCNVMLLFNLEDVMHILVVEILKHFFFQFQCHPITTISKIRGVPFEGLSTEQQKNQYKKKKK